MDKKTQIQNGNQGGKFETRLYFSKFNIPEEFPDTKSINCGHPNIARFLVKVGNWFFRAFKV